MRARSTHWHAASAVMIGLGGATAASADVIATWFELSQWTADMTAAGAATSGFMTTDVLHQLPMGAPVASDAFTVWGITMESSAPLQAYNDGGGFTDVWGGVSHPSMSWDIVLATPVYSAYLFASGSVPISFFLGNQLVAQPWGTNQNSNFSWLGVLLDTPFDRIRIQYPGAQHSAVFGGFYSAMPVPGPSALGIICLQASMTRIRSRRRR